MQHSNEAQAHHVSLYVTVRCDCLVCDTTHAAAFALQLPSSAADGLHSSEIQVWVHHAVNHAWSSRAPGIRHDCGQTALDCTSPHCHAPTPTLKTRYDSVECCLQVLLPVMIFTAGPISGAHFNPMVTSVFMMARMQVCFLCTGTTQEV